MIQNTGELEFVPFGLKVFHQPHPRQDPNLAGGLESSDFLAKKGNIWQPIIGEAQGGWPWQLKRAYWG